METRHHGSGTLVRYALLPVRVPRLCARAYALSAEPSHWKDTAMSGHLLGQLFTVFSSNDTLHGGVTQGSVCASVVEFMVHMFVAVAVSAKYVMRSLFRPLIQFVNFQCDTCLCYRRQVGNLGPEFCPFCKHRTTCYVRIRG